MSKRMGRRRGIRPTRCHQVVGGSAPSKKDSGAVAIKLGSQAGPPLASFTSQAKSMMRAMVRMRLILSGSKTRLENTLKKRGATTSAASQPASMTPFSQTSSFVFTCIGFAIHRSAVSILVHTVVYAVRRGYSSFISYLSAGMGSNQRLIT
jgi:hypothetical protein